MKKNPTPLGQFLRKLRISNNEVLADMAQKLGITSAYLSAIELGKRSIPKNLFADLIELYSISKDEEVELQKAIDTSVTSVEIDLDNVSLSGRETVLAFARKLKDLDDVALNNIFEFLKDNQEDI
jgi:transcriptional regulator with XRE-family HTH domain